MANVISRLAEIRKRRGVAAAQLASQVHVSRQTIYAIEAGSYVPNTEIALQLARQLEVTVDELFALPAAPKGLLLAGCDPASGLLIQMVEKLSGLKIACTAVSSRVALTWLKEGKVQIAGSHLEDRKTGEFNLPIVRREFGSEKMRVIAFANWEVGWVVAPGNPMNIRQATDLARKTIRFANREEGSGSRTLFDKLLKSAGIAASSIVGYERVAQGHLAAAYLVSSKEAHACLATRFAAQTFGLDFIPLRRERYDLVMRRRTAELPEVQTFLDVLQRAVLRRKLEALAGYDTAQTGAQLV